MTPKEVLEYAKENEAVMVDFKFVDLFGTWQHFTTPLHQLEESSFEEGYGFDGSSIRGWQPINMSDMIVKPDPTTAKMDPFTQEPTLSLICNVFDPITHEPYTKDPRYVAQKAVEYLKSTGIADTAFIGPEAEFFVFDDVRYTVDRNIGYFEVDSVEGAWNSAADYGPNQGYRPKAGGGYFPCAPCDSLMDLRTEMCQVMEEVGITIEAQHHEVATAGQCEIDMKFAPLLDMADQLMWYKYVVKNVAFLNGKSATFMPKPLFEDNGSGMHTHQSLWLEGKPLMAGDGYAGFSQLGLHYIGGIIKHAPAILAFSNATVNSYKRLVPGFEAPTKLAYSSRNRSAAVRIPMYSSSPKAKRLEFRTPDATGNPYLAFSAMLMAGLDGIKNQIDPGEPLDKDIYGLSPEELADIKSVPASLAESVDALASDHEFLLEGGVFTEDLIHSYIDYKRENEIEPAALRPAPIEFDLYYDI